MESFGNEYGTARFDRRRGLCYSISCREFSTQLLVFWLPKKHYLAMTCWFNCYLFWGFIYQAINSYRSFAEFSTWNSVDWRCQQEYFWMGCKLSSGNRCNNQNILNLVERTTHSIVELIYFKSCTNSSLHGILRIVDRVANYKMSFPRWLCPTSCVASRRRFI